MENEKIWSSSDLENLYSKVSPIGSDSISVLFNRYDNPKVPGEIVILESVTPNPMLPVIYKYGEGRVSKFNAVFVDTNKDRLIIFFTDNRGELLYDDFPMNEFVKPKICFKKLNLDK